MTGELKGAEFLLDLPIRLSPEAQREALLATGRDVQPDQVFEIRDLQTIPDADRERVVALTEKVRLSTDLLPLDDSEDGGPLRVIGYGYGPWLHLGASDQWELFDREAQEGESTEIDCFFFAGPDGHTRRLRDEFLTRVDDPASAEAMLMGTPLVKRLQEKGVLKLHDVLDAYEAAISLAEEMEKLARKGKTFILPFFDSVYVDEDLVVFVTSRAPRARPAGFLQEADPKTFEALAEATQLAKELLSDDRDFANEVCHAALRLSLMGASDAQIWKLAIHPQVKNAMKQAEQARRRAEARAEYEAHRGVWIENHGSRRLKLAAQRDYKHDGIYRDERLANELPGFVALRGKLKIGEDVNPTEEALEREAETMARVKQQDLADVTVKLVWLSSEDFDGPADGEYVQVANYLGRHTVYRPVVQEDIPVGAADDDIPF